MIGPDISTTRPAASSASRKTALPSVRLSLCLEHSGIGFSDVKRQGKGPLLKKFITEARIK
eukprot:scaffold4769_cov45-Attheya_sp.AAC.3